MKKDVGIVLVGVITLATFLGFKARKEPEVLPPEAPPMPPLPPLVPPLPPEEAPPEWPPPEEPIPTPPPIPPAVADIRVENLVIEFRELLIGEVNHIKVTAKNYGGAKGTKTIKFKVDSVTAQEVVTLEPGASIGIIFEVTAHAVKTYAISVDGLTDAFVVHAAPLPPGIEEGMLPPEGWEWIRPIQDQEIRAAERRAASTGETILEALLVLYGKEIPAPPVAEILDVWQGPDIYARWGEMLPSIIVAWELRAGEDPIWNYYFKGIKLRRTVSPFGTAAWGASAWTGTLSPGRHHTQIMLADAVPPGTYPITFTLIRAHGGITYPRVDEVLIPSFKGTVEITH